LVIHGALGLACALTAFFLLRQAPRAYALHAWGLKYPRVLAIRDGCFPELREGLASGACRVWDLSAGARERVLLRWGSDCRSEMFNRSLPWSYRAGLPRNEVEPCILDLHEEPIFGSR
jgi:hypothetical protein